MFQSEEFGWSNELQGYILAAFFCGYIMTQIIGGRLAERFGGKYFYGGSISSSATLHLMLPAAARISVYLLIALLITQGLLMVRNQNKAVIFFFGM